MLGDRHRPSRGLDWAGDRSVAARVGEGLGGLLNATFGNAAELIIAGIALSKGLTSVVKASHHRLDHRQHPARSRSLDSAAEEQNKRATVQPDRRAHFRHFALARCDRFDHSYCLSFGRRRQSERLESGRRTPVVVRHRDRPFPDLHLRAWFHSQNAQALLRRRQGRVRRKSDHWSRSKAITILLLATAVVALLSEFLVGTIESVRTSLGITEVFVGVIVVAIVGNAAEHSTAVVMALKNKMDLSVGIAVGSSLQIALFVAPVLVFCSYAFGRPMNLEFSLPEIFAVVVSVYILFQISGDGETNWLEGVQLLSVYLILGIFIFLSARDSGAALKNQGAAISKSPKPFRHTAVRKPPLLEPSSFAQRMNDEADDRDADARIRHIKSRPGMRERNMQIEKQKIDYMTVHQAVGEISEHAGQQERQRKIAHKIPRTPAQQQSGDKQKRGAGKDDKKVLLFRNDPKAAPVFVTWTKSKKSGITTRGCSGSTKRSTRHFVN